MEEKAEAGRPLTYAEFVAYAEAREGRFEYIDGRAVAMAPPSIVHQRLATRLTTALANHLAGGECEVIAAPGVWTIVDRRERVPDIVVFCQGKPSKLVVEVLSPNRGDDLDDKLDEYGAMPAFEEYVLVDSTKRSVRIFRRNGDAKFSVERLHIAGPVRLHSIGFTLDIDALYDDSGVA